MIFLGVFRDDIRSPRERVGVANCEERRKKQKEKKEDSDSHLQHASHESHLWPAWLYPQISFLLFYFTLFFTLLKTKNKF